MSTRPDRTTIPPRVTYEDYRQFPDDGMRYEILDGEIFMTPAPSPAHQYTSKRLQRTLEGYFEGERRHLVFNAPIDVILSDADVVQPDLVVVQEGPQISARGIEGTPLLLVEILSPSKPQYDRVTKARRYAERGVPHYWIVDPQARTVECFRLDRDNYQPVATGRDHDEVGVPGFDGLTLPLAALWIHV
jgi:Uma2 family endonuclease